MRYIEAGVIPRFAACASQGVPWFQERGLWQDNSYEPRPGNGWVHILISDKPDVMNDADFEVWHFTDG